MEHSEPALATGHTTSWNEVERWPGQPKLGQPEPGQSEQAQPEQGHSEPASATEQNPLWNKGERWQEVGQTKLGQPAPEQPEMEPELGQIEAAPEQTKLGAE